MLCCETKEDRSLVFASDVGTRAIAGSGGWIDDYIVRYDQMNEEQAKLLEQIESGITIFEPFYRRSKELLEFQQLVETLLELEAEKLIGRVWTQQQHISGVDYYDVAVVYSGMRDEGSARSGRVASDIG